MSYRTTLLLIVSRMLCRHRCVCLGAHMCACARVRAGGTCASLPRPAVVLFTHVVYAAAPAHLCARVCVAPVLRHVFIHVHVCAHSCVHGVAHGHMSGADLIWVEWPVCFRRQLRRLFTSRTVQVIMS